MNLFEYFNNADGIGILATADAEGKVDLAVYTKPKVLDDHTVAFVMREQLSHQNVKRNPQAAYMFIESVLGNQGVRLYLTKGHEETNQSVVDKIIEEHPEICPYGDEGKKFFVHFHVDRIRELVGTKSMDRD